MIKNGFVRNDSCFDISHIDWKNKPIKYDKNKNKLTIENKLIPDWLFNVYFISFHQFLKDWVGVF